MYIINIIIIIDIINFYHLKITGFNGRMFKRAVPLERKELPSQENEPEGKIVLLCNYMT